MKQQDFVNWVRDHDWQQIIGGVKRESASGEKFSNWSSALESEICELPNGNAEDVNLAVELGKAASREWAKVPPRKRADKIREMARIAREHADELAMLDAIDVGNAYSLMVKDVEAGVDGMEFMADAAIRLSGEIYNDHTTHMHYTRHEPFGVVARIVAFNHPIMFALQKIAAPLIAGNAVILKPSDNSALSALRMAELFEGVLPEGLLSVLIGKGPTLPSAIVKHPDILRIGFIGSEGVGRAIQRDAAEVAVKDISLELGGKNAIIVCEDVDIPEAAAGVVKGMNFLGWQSQSCSSTSRLLVHESIADELLAEMVKIISQIRIGNPFEPETQMGTVASQAQYDKTHSYIDKAKSEGAELVTGAQRGVSEDIPGLFIAPTIFDRVRPDSTLAMEEVFGPILAVIRWTDVDEAVKIANKVAYGLTGAVWTNNARLSHRLAHELETGYVWVNDAAAHYTGVPFGGYKASGIGKEESVEELLSYSRVKTVNYKL